MNPRIQIIGGRNSGKTFALKLQYTVTFPTVPPPRKNLWKRFLGWLKKCRTHDWATTATNGFYHPSEERCMKCGEYRHLVHDFEKFRRGEEEEWKPGRHPLSK
jgi:hypothetical protein